MSFAFSSYLARNKRISNAASTSIMASIVRLSPKKQQQQQEELLLDQKAKLIHSSTLRHHQPYQPTGSSLSSVPTMRTFSSPVSIRIDEEEDDDDNQEDILAEVADANERYKGRLVIRDTRSHGWGIYSERDWKVGELLMQGRALNAIRNEKTSHTIQYDVDKHAHLDLPGRFINHVCGIANVGIQIKFQQSILDGTINKENNDHGYNNIVDDVLFQFYAIKDIQTGDELLWDYETTEYDVIAKFDCLCGSPICRKKLMGFIKHGDAVLKAYGGQWVAPYLLKLWKNKPKNDENC